MAERGLRTVLEAEDVVVSTDVVQGLLQHLASATMAPAEAAVDLNTAAEGRGSVQRTHKASLCVATAEAAATVKVAATVEVAGTVRGQEFLQHLASTTAPAEAVEELSTAAEMCGRAQRMHKANLCVVTVVAVAVAVAVAVEDLAASSLWTPKKQQ
jgi:hypothetical protein